MIVAEVALSVVFLVAAGLLVRSFVRFRARGSGMIRPDLSPSASVLRTRRRRPIVTSLSKRSCAPSRQRQAFAGQRLAVSPARYCRQRYEGGRSPSKDRLARRRSICSSAKRRSSEPDTFA